MKKIKYKIKGSGNIIIIHPETRLSSCLLFIKGSNCKIEIGKHCILANTQLWIEDDLGIISIGSNTTCEGAHIAVTEGKSITIGNDCMLSSNIQLRNGDSHSILDLSNKKHRINNAKDTTIEDHVWIGEGVRILKGALIKSNSIVGTGSVVTNVVENNSIYAGNPAKKIKENIIWDRKR